MPTRFTVSENGLEWAGNASPYRRNDIFVTPISSILDGRSQDVEITNGYYFDDSDPRGADGSRLSVVYDLDRRRVYMWRTTL